MIFDPIGTSGEGNDYQCLHSPYVGNPLVSGCDVTGETNLLTATFKDKLIHHFATRSSPRFSKKKVTLPSSGTLHGASSTLPKQAHPPIALVHSILHIIIIWAYISFANEFRAASG